MLCKEFEKRVWDYLGGRIPRSPAEKFEAHLQKCPRCRETLARAEKLRELLRTAAPPDPGPAYLAAFWPRLRAKLADRGKAVRARSFIRLNPLYYAALGTAAAALVLWVSLQEPAVPASPPGGHRECVLALASCPSDPEISPVDFVSPPVSVRKRPGPADTDSVLSGTSRRPAARFDV
ncbi:MAG: zf-HC2 domain-containing protein [PVC group bacterium]